jgi:hypothetical protein
MQIIVCVASNVSIATINVAVDVLETSAIGLFHSEILWQPVSAP